MQKLNQRERKFVECYLEIGNASKAAIQAGYSVRSSRATGTKLLNKANVQAAINDRMEELKSSKIASETEILEYLTSVVRGEARESLPTVNGVEGNLPPTIKDRTKAAELIGKRLVMWTEKKEVSANFSPVQIIDDLTKGSADNG